MGKKKKGANYLNLALQALQPYSYVGPDGSTYVDQTNHQITYTPKYLPGQKEAMDLGSQKILDVLKQLDTNFGTFNVNDAYNNPIYQNTRDLFMQPLLQQKEQDDKRLQDELNASNQLGGSYDAYSRNLQNTRYDNAFRQNDLQARQAAYDAWNNQKNSLLNTLGTLQGNQTSGLAQQNAGFTNGLNAQQAMTPLQGGVSSLYAGGIRGGNQTPGKRGVSAGGAIGGALSGAAAGATFGGPWGAGIGGLLGGLGGLFG